MSSLLQAPLPERLAAFGRRHADALLLAAVTAAAAAPRLWSLGALPRGVHGDEAQFAMDAQRVLDSGWIGVYTASALGQPAGIAYVLAPGQWLFGATPLGARFGVALVSILAAPLAYALFRQLAGRAVATFAALLLAVSLWHIHLGRVAAPTALVPTSELLTLTFWALGLRRGDWYWFLLAGASLGLGIYTYNVYPIFVVAFAFWVLAHTFVWERGPGLSLWLRNVAIAALASFVVALPLFAYAARGGGSYFNHYRSYYEQYSVLQSPPFQQGGFGEKLGVLLDQVQRFFGAYAWQGVTDYVDGAAPHGEPMLGALLLGLVLLGAAFVLRRAREPANSLCLIMVAVIPLTSILQTNATYRGPLGAAPFLLYFAAVPLAFAWERGAVMRPYAGAALRGAAVLALLLVAYRDVALYFRDWARSPVFDWVYARQISAASTYAQSLPDRPYVYFYSERWSFNYETRQYLAPGLAGEDRSREFGQHQGFDIDRSRDALILLLPPYVNDAEQIRQRYPSGLEFVMRDGGETLFIAYLVPRRGAALPRLVRGPPASGRLPGRVRAGPRRSARAGRGSRAARKAQERRLLPARGRSTSSSWVVAALR